MGKANHSQTRIIAPVRYVFAHSVVRADMPCRGVRTCAKGQSHMQRDGHFFGASASRWTIYLCGILPADVTETCLFWGATENQIERMAGDIPTKAAALVCLFQCVCSTPLGEIYGVFVGLSIWKRSTCSISSMVTAITVEKQLNTRTENGRAAMSKRKNFCAKLPDRKNKNATVAGRDVKRHWMGNAQTLLFDIFLFRNGHEDNSSFARSKFRAASKVCCVTCACRI